MIDPEIIAREISDKAKGYFQNSTFSLIRQGLQYKSTSNHLSNAVSREAESIKVVKWFDDFWLYVNIKYDKDPEKKEDFQVYFSLMLFIGKESDQKKIPLFRAEWDNYEDNEYHPQPHWHFYVDSEKQVMIQNFTDMLSGDSTPGFMEYIQEETSPKMDLNKFHFAMNALWHNNNGHIHKIDNNNDFVQWFVGLLGHIKYQLEYI